MYGRLLCGLRRFLNEPLTAADARESISARLANREKLLIGLVRKTIYDNPTSPYLPLLRWAGCEFGDFERLVASTGVDAALAGLAGQGVYVSAGEFKARTPMVRGGLTVDVRERDFDNPCLSPQVETKTGGSRSAGTRTAYDLEFLADSWSAHLVVALEALGVRKDAPYGIWLPIMPGAGPIVLLAYTKCGFAPTKWFSPLTLQDMRPSVKSRVGTRGLLAAGRLFGARWPPPEYVAPDDAERVARWIHDQLRKHGACCFNSYTSTAVRVCQAAAKASLDLTGAVFLFGGEPLTRAKHEAIVRAGVSRYLVMYGSMDSGYLGLSCFSPQECDEVHLFDDSFAFGELTRQTGPGGGSIDALLVSSLLPTTPKVLLNVETGDWGSLGKRSCGCAWDQLGLSQHMHTIRSFDKLTSEGMSFVGGNLARVLDEILPRRFGGGIGDYQVVEEEEETGQSRLSILVSPDVGTVDEEELVRTFLDALSIGKDHHRMMARMWLEAKTLRVRREPPSATDAGKILPLHIKRAPRPG